MVFLRATQRVLKSLPQSDLDECRSDTALGDWYVNRVLVDRQPLLILVSSESLLTILEPARSVKTLPGRLGGLVANRLQRLGVDRHLIDLEIKAMKVVCVGRTKDRSVTGTLIDFAKTLPYYLPSDGWDARDLREAEDQFSQTPCRCGRSFQETVWPRKKAVSLLTESWQSLQNVH